MILLNFDFFNEELVNNTIAYLKEEPKALLLKEGEKWFFDGTGFKNKTKLMDFLKYRVQLYDKEIIKDLNSPDRRTNKETVRKLYDVFIEETPLYIDTEKLDKMLILSSSLMFYPNDKTYISLICTNPYKSWTVKQLETETKKYVEITFKDLEECLSRHTKPNSVTDAILTCEPKDGTNYYKLNFTNLFNYIRHFEKALV